ncbi:fatty acid desaturase [Alkalinema pantanalense CENA528]|uniref:fatty acid desaturase n=1 Tax=Alkalinema pantanalense TaxID=1620705 RepID=UPI003D702083
MAAAKQPLAVPRELVGAPGPGQFNPNLSMFIAAVVIAAFSSWGYFELHWAGWITFCLNFLALHLVGTVIHDACHGVAHRSKVVNAILGHGSAFLLWFSFPVFTRVHMQHHANVNDPENDPDHIVSTMGPLWLINARFMYHEVYFFQRKLWKKFELYEWILARSSAVLLLWLAYHFGVIHYIFNFWFTPLALVGLELGLFFDYLPHRPFKERDRWLNARVYPGRILNYLIGGQNYHLVHHLWPAVPWYNYEKVYFAMKPLLDEKGCHQTLGVFTEDPLHFIYDVFIGIRRRHRTAEAATPSVGEPMLNVITDSVEPAALESQSLESQSLESQSLVPSEPAQPV